MMSVTSVDGAESDEPQAFKLPALVDVADGERFTLRCLGHRNGLSLVPKVRVRGIETEKTIDSARGSVRSRKISC